MGFQQITNEFYLDKERTTLDKNKLPELRTVLKSVQRSDLGTLDEHREYISLLRKFREAIVQTASLNGENFNSTLASLLSVGADGLYTNELRFLFELIQNVDDCDYNNPEDCELSIHFDFNYGTITLEYNEVGFSPENVFSITGIAEAAKNISPDRIEIGEKGIGFKSVFGVADKVLVQSGMFSFMLYENNSTVPEERYDGFSGVSGTKLTLFMKTRNPANRDDKALARERGAICRKIYDKLVTEYCTTTALFNKNPILFLNKLTKIRMYFDSFDSLEFSVSKGLKKTRTPEGLDREDGVVISSSLSARHRYMSQQETMIVCTRYTMPIEYNREMCVSRYDSKTAFQKKQMRLQAVIPNPEYVSEVDCGALYSFLPTQVRTTAPVSCHIPFKLDSSRENVDDQGENAWFRHSRDTFAQMLHSIYIDYARLVKNEILTYVPHARKCFFAVDRGNDKLACLKSDVYLGAAFLRDKILYTEENHFRSAAEVFSFHPDENITDPISLYLLLNCDKELFVAPGKCNVLLYGIEVMRDALYQLFTRAMQMKIHVQEALDILDSSDISYTELVNRLPKKQLSVDLLCELSRHPRCIKAFNESAILRIKENRALEFDVTNSKDIKDVHFIISPDEPIDESFLDEVVARYLYLRKYTYITAELDKKAPYFVGKNVLVLSSHDTLNAFAQFCHDVEKDDYFAANMKMRSASIKLNEAEDSLSVPEFMKLLREVRSSIKTAFGKKHYDSYIKVIRELNSDPQRFIRELIQNADDCQYPEGVCPAFNLTVDGNIITTSYNECGFQKKNVRSITAIGESTKKQLRTGSFEIGEKGIGFKTVFAVADSVDIYSNEFHFRLKAETPTIPDKIAPFDADLTGTKMVFSLRKRLSTTFATDTVLALCLCLRKLKDIDINGIRINIEDADGKRMIRIGNQEYIFDIYKHTFVVDDVDALVERANGTKAIDENQEIIFYVSERQIAKFHYYLYCGLPTAIELGVPMAIDVPFELTASRDNVLQNAWNIKLKQEMYIAYTDVLKKIARKSRINVLQFVRFQAQQYGSQIKFSLFKNDEDSWLDNSSILDDLKMCQFIPTYDDQYFAAPSDLAYRYPRIVHLMLDKSQLNEKTKRSIIDDPKNEENENKLRNLGCKQVDTSEIVRILCERAHLHIEDDKYRTALYRYLAETPELRPYSQQLRSTKIIPIKGKYSPQEISYVSFNEMSIFVDETAAVSTPEYGILNTKILPKNTLERILGVDIVVIDSRYKKSLYDDKLEGILTSTATNAEKYRQLISELKCSRSQFNASLGVLLQNKNRVPLLTEDGEYHTEDVFITTLESGYFYGKLLNSHIASKEAMELAKLIGCRDISLVSYEDLGIRTQITADDIEDLQMPDIRYGYHILEQCIFEGFISEELIEKYGLSGIKRTDYTGVFDESDFPNEPVKNHNNLRSQIQSQSRSAREIIKVQELRTVDKVRLPNGKEQSINSSEIRENTIKRYRPASNTDGCFCQMCRTVKSTEYIEVNNIWAQPKYYWPQMRIVLCLDCSKRFEAMRSNKEIIEQFYRSVKSANVHTSEPITIPIGNADIRFTQTHLAEIQAILQTNKQ